MIRYAFFLFLALATTKAFSQTQQQNPFYTCGFSNFQAEIIQRVNQARATARNCGSRSFKAAGPISWDAKLTTSAAGHSYDMAKNNYFDHRSRDGRTFVNRIEDAGYAWSSVGENISVGRRSVAEAINAWIASPPHCANIMNPRFTQVGVACVLREDTRYKYHWTMNLGRPRQP